MDVVRMTVGANVKSCYFTIKSAEATLEQLALKTTTKESEQAYLEAKRLLAEVKSDLKEQVLFLAREEPQYK